MTRPDGSTVELVPATAGAASVAFSQTELARRVLGGAGLPDPDGRPVRRRRRRRHGRPTGSAGRATLAPGASPTAVPTAPPVDPNAPVRFAVDLFDPSESDIAPGSPSAIVALGRQPGASGPPAPGAADEPAPTAAPGASAVPGGATATSRRRPATSCGSLVVLIVLVVLLAEWLVYHRDAVTRLWRGLRRDRPERRSDGRAR